MIKGSTMTQEERWPIRYQDVMDFMEKNHRNPSKYVRNAASETGSSSKRSAWTQVRWKANAKCCSMSLLG